jgi:branched-chain amino acid transport system permease protein
LGFSPWVAMIFVIAMGFIIGIMLGWPSLRIKGIYLSLTTIGFGEIIRLFLTNASDLTGGTHGVMQIPTYHFFRIKIDDSKKFYYFLLVFSIIMVVIALRVVHSKWGRVFKAIKDNEQAAEACGVNIAEIKIKAFILSTTYACVAGAFYAHLMGYINPADFNRDRSIKYLMMLMLGGLGSVPGSIIGGSVVTMLPEYLRFLKDYYWLIFSVIVLIIVMVLPHGLVSIFRNPFIVKERFAKNDSSKGRK